MLCALANDDEEAARLLAAAHVEADDRLRDEIGSFLQAVQWVRTVVRVPKHAH